MTEEERLYMDVEKLDVNPGDVLIISAADIGFATELKSLAKKLSDTFKTMVILIGPGDCIAALDREMMESYGWVRKEG